ncbi:DUF1016 family protein [bacterium]|nr:DUF1016 family protein [bacterium]
MKTKTLHQDNKILNERNSILWIDSIKRRVKEARLKAFLAANAEQLLLYWDIGNEILRKQEQEGWGAKIVNRLSKELSNEFPNMNGWSVRNLKYMRSLSQSWARDEIMQAPLAQLPWYHHIALMEKLKSRGERLNYASLAVKNGWSRNAMIRQIKEKAFDDHGKAVTNFQNQLPPEDSDMAISAIKGEYDLGFLETSKQVKENKLRSMLVDKIAKFLIELGTGFSYVGKGMPIIVGGDTFELDLLFYHTLLHRYVVIELKAGKFNPRDIGQLSFYMTAIDRNIKTKQDKKTIGLLLCRSRNKVVAEYALADIDRPMGIATYELGLPTIEQLQKKLSNVL